MVEPAESKVYQVELNAEGKIQSVRQGDQAISLGEDSQVYCDFLTWAVRQPREVAGEHSTYVTAWFFSDMSRLVEYCKTHAIMLATQNPLFTQNPELEAAAPVVYDGLKFHGMQSCATPPPGWRMEAVPDGIIPRAIPVFVTESLVERVNDELTNDRSDIRRLSSWPIERSFVYVDVSDFSRYTPGPQALIVNSIISIIGSRELWSARLFRQHEAMLCIGDGYIFVLGDAMVATEFAAHLAHLIEVLVAKRAVPIEFHFRMGVHTGPVYSFWDPGRNDWNFTGDGINGGNRVLSAVGKETDDVLFVSADVRQKIIAGNNQTTRYRNLIANLHNRGRRNDKHGNP